MSDHSGSNAPTSPSSNANNDSNEEKKDDGTTPNPDTTNNEEAKKDLPAPAPVLKVDLDTNPQDSVAFTLLDDLTKRIGADEVEALKAVYQRLWEGTREAFSQEKGMLKKSRQLNNDVLGERVAMEKARIRQQDEQDHIEHLERERDASQKLLDEAEHSNTVVKYELQELTSVHNDLEDRLLEMKAENEKNVGPELERLRKELVDLKAESDATDDAHEKDVKRKKELTAIFEKLSEEQDKNEDEEKVSKLALVKAQAEPERIKKQADSVSKAVDSLSAEVYRLTEKIKNGDAEILRQQQKRKEAEDIKTNLNHKLELHRDTIDHRQRDVEAVRKNLDLEKAKHHQLTTQRLELELSRKEVSRKIEDGECTWFA